MTLYDLADFLETIMNDKYESYWLSMSHILWVIVSSSVQDIRDELDKYREEGMSITEVFRAREADDQFEKLEMEENIEKLRNQNAKIGNIPRRGRFIWLI